MGLDIFIFEIVKEEDKLIRVYNELVGEEEKRKEVFYWRKDYTILNWFQHYFREVENCGNYVLKKIDFKNFLSDLKNGDLGEDREREIKAFEKILKDKDFDKKEYIFHAWW